LESSFFVSKSIFKSLYLSTSIMGRTRYTNPWVPKGHTHVTCNELARELVTLHPLPVHLHYYISIYKISLHNIMNTEVTKLIQGMNSRCI
jgi:hypothetical protein